MGWDIVATDALNWVTLKLDAETVKSILDEVTMRMTERAEAQDPALAKADEEIHKPVQETAILARATQACINLHVADWVTTQQEDPVLKTAIELISNWKVQDLKHLLGDDANNEEGKTILGEWRKLTLYQGALYHCHTPMGELEEVLQFIVPIAHWVAAMNGCHWDAGHQGQKKTLYLIHDQFWWQGRAMQMQNVISNCKWCIQHEGSCAKALMWPIIVTVPLELLHIDFTSIETMMDQPPKCGEPFGLLWPLYETCHGGMWPPIKMLMCMIGKLSKDQEMDWLRHLPKLVHLYNSTRSAITGYSPHYLMFGHWPHLSIDFYFPTVTDMKKHQHVDHYVAELCEWLCEAFKEAQV